MASETVDYTALLAAPNFGVVQVQLTSPAPVVAGRQYAIVLSGAPAGVTGANYILGVTTIDAYPGGDVWSRSSTGTWQIYGSFMGDWWLRPYVAPWTFSGFLPPVENTADDSVNHVKAGASVPVKFSLAGDKGLDVIAAGYPKLEPTPCDASADVDPVEETTTAKTGLTYDPATDTYTYVWKTQKRWAGTCGALRLQLNDGSTHSRLQLQVIGASPDVSLPHMCPVDLLRTDA